METKHEGYFWKKVRKTSTCWLWIGGVSSRGYGNFAYKEKGKVINNRAHRFAFTLTKGKIPQNLFVCHRCDIPLCVRPAHLFLGNAQENALDMVRKGRANPPLGEKSASAKLTAEQVVRIRHLRATGSTTAALAVEFGVVRQQISRIVNKQRWSHLK